jgi:hypothetical protein
VENGPGKTVLLPAGRITDSPTPQLSLVMLSIVILPSAHSVSWDQVHVGIAEVYIASVWRTCDA